MRLAPGDADQAGSGSVEPAPTPEPSASVEPSPAVPHDHYTDVLPRHGAPGGGRTTPPGSVLLAVGLLLLAGLGLTAGWLRYQGDHDAARPAAAGPADTRPPAVSLSGPSAGPDASPAPTPTPTAHASIPAPTPTAPPASPPAPKPTATAPVPVVDRSVPVVVLNATARTGLAAHVAASLRHDGWTVVSVGNWRRGGVGQTTVFVTGHAAAASTMQHDVPTADVVRAPLAGMPSGRLVLVIGPDYPR